MSLFEGQTLDRFFARLRVNRFSFNSDSPNNRHSNCFGRRSFSLAVEPRIGFWSCQLSFDFRSLDSRKVWSKNANFPIQSTAKLSPNLRYHRNFRSAHVRTTTILASTPKSRNSFTRSRLNPTDPFIFIFTFTFTFTFSFFSFCYSFILPCVVLSLHRCLDRQLCQMPFKCFFIIFFTQSTSPPFYNGAKLLIYRGRWRLNFFAFFHFVVFVLYHLLLQTLSPPSFFFL